MVIVRLPEFADASMLVKLSVVAVSKLLIVAEPVPAIVRLVADVAVTSKSLVVPYSVRATVSIPARVNSVAFPPVKPATVTVAVSAEPDTSLYVMV